MCCEYSNVSKLSKLETLPDLAADDFGRIRFDLSLEGHSVVKLHLEERR